MNCVIACGTVSLLLCTGMSLGTLGRDSARPVSYEHKGHDSGIHVPQGEQESLIQGCFEIKTQESEGSAYLPRDRSVGAEREFTPR